MLVDRFGRTATDLRVSVTDKCDLRCTYCMPAEGLPWLPREEVLTDDEIVRLVRIGVERLGIREVRLTGGEPLIRPGLPGLIGRLAELAPRPRLSLTTNGVSLARLAEPLKAAGLDRVNVSLDTLDPQLFRTLTRRDRHDRVIAGIDAALSAGVGPVKINTVLMRGVNDHEAADLLRWSLERGCELRFIEQMPLDAQHGWDREKMVTADEILEQLSAEFDLVPEGAEARGTAPAETWLVAGYRTPDGRPARVGVIASVTRPFCGDCDRVRLTADGQMRTCLFARDESDLRTALRGGAADSEIAERWRVAFQGKKAGAGIGEPDFVQPVRPMSAIGG
ncbi:GTP 3',8-cyclase MoaA [Actinospica sp. MGRD01-02]|uniref:GTP 3',8-cyclase n=1 Tax=Actinospica acidithermotolerans TaxID=2828514 RepID=A0A941E9N0_9ACTN|nr:GTP 3',8-cyclase MoaA [Actinospica acidithermotolerans]MBR7827541.1 GTP 3',8-cyclase MoaA [Actinospica acidithermotolerans]